MDEEMKRLIKERDEARAEVKKLSESAKAAWEAECVMRGQRDQWAVALKNAQQEVERLRESIGPFCPCNECVKCAYRRGAEAMREACAKWMSEREGIAQWVYDDALRALPIPEDK